jgi:hypothetical protein
LKNLNTKEHKDYKWLTPSQALKLNLIPDEDKCIEMAYNQIIK